VKEAGLGVIDELLVLPPNTCKYFVVVTPMGVEPDIKVPKTHFLPKTNPNNVFPVFHYFVSKDILFLQQPERLVVQP
jgi:hypothetical protein